MATSVGGALTGRGADLIIVDDPQKADDALSEVSRKATHTWFDNTRSRINDRRTGAIIMSRSACIKTTSSVIYTSPVSKKALTGYGHLGPPKRAAFRVSANCRLSVPRRTACLAMNRKHLLHCSP